MEVRAGWNQLMAWGPLQLVVASVQRWLNKRASSKGAALALYMIFSLVPVLVLVIATAGWFFGEDNIRTQLLAQITAMAGERTAETVRMVLDSANQSGKDALAAWLSAGLLIFSSTTAFNELKASMDEIWDVEAGGMPLLEVARSRIVAFGLVLVLAGVLLTSVVLDAALAVLLRYLHDMLGEFMVQAQIARVVSSSVTLVTVVGLLAVIFKMLPGTRILWRDVLPGALLTAVLFLGGKGMIGAYLSQGNVVSSYGAAGSVIALLLWVYYSALILFFGAAFCREYWGRYGTGRLVLARRARRAREAAAAAAATDSSQAPLPG